MPVGRRRTRDKHLPRGGGVPPGTSILAPPIVRYATGLALSYGTDRPAVLALEQRHLTDAGLVFARCKTGRGKSAGGATICGRLLAAPRPKC